MNQEQKKRKLEEIEDDISEEAEIKINKEKLEELREKYDPNDNLITEISEDVMDEFEKSETFIKIVRNLTNKRLYKILKLKEMENNKKKYDGCSIEYDQPEGKNICDNNKELVKYIDNEVNDEVTEIIDNDETGLLVETYFPESKMLIVISEHDKIIDKVKYYTLIGEKQYKKNKIVQIKYY